jgi:long-chain fatty acid transport protein
VNRVVAYRVTRALSVGIGATINYAEAELTRGIVQPGDEFKVKGAGTALGFNAGVLWQPTERHSFGVRYHSAIEPTLSGHTSVRTRDFTVATPFGRLTVPGSSSEEDAHADLQFPQFLTLGYSFLPTPDWNIEVNADWTDWNSLDEIAVFRGDAETGRVPLHWRSNWFYSLGVTRSWTNGWRASLGYSYAEKMVPEATFTPAVPDSDRHVFTTGLGYRGERWSLDIAYQFTHQPARRIDLGSVTDGTYRLDAHAIAVSAGVEF